MDILNHPLIEDKCIKHTDIRLLIVDDDPDLLFATSRLLKRAGYCVSEAATALEGIAHARQFQTDLILMDVNLPDMDGREACRRLKEDPKTAGIYIIIISSAKISSIDQSTGLELGADDYILRPIHNRELVARITAFVRLKRVEKNLHKREQLLTAVVNGIKSELFIIDSSMNIHWMNEAAKKSLPQDNRDITKTKCHEYFINLDGPCKACPGRKTFKTKRPEESVIEFPGGVVKHCKSEPLLDDDGNLYRVLTIETDITRQKMLENELIAHQNQLEAVVEKRTMELQKEINNRKLAETILLRQKKNIAIHNRIANVFLTSPPEALHGHIIDTILDVFNSRFGYFGFCDDTGDLDCLLVNRKTPPSGQSSQKTMVFQQRHWKAFWGESLLNKASMLSNEKLLFFDGSTCLNNALVAPLLAHDRLIGQIAIADAPEGYTPNDRRQLELLSGYISPFLVMAMERESANERLLFHAKKLEEKNIALNVVLENRDENMKKMADTILNNFDRLVFPFHEKLKQCHRKEDITTLLSIVQENTLESLAPLEKSVSVKYRLFTPMEIQVADLIKAGKSSKEIASILSISERAVFFHRNNIRTKFKINKTRVNLRSFLQSL